MRPRSSTGPGRGRRNRPAPRRSRAPRPAPYRPRPARAEDARCGWSAVTGERIEEIVVVDAGQRIDRIDAVRGKRRDRGVGGRHRCPAALLLRSDLRSGLRPILAMAEPVIASSAPRLRMSCRAVPPGSGPSRRAGTRALRALTKAASRALSAFRPEHYKSRRATMHRYRSHTCGALRASDIGNDVRLSGWCHRIRDHGGVLFIDLRDHYGITQVVADPDSPGLQGGGDAALRMGGAHRRQGAAAAGRHRECRPADRRGRGLHPRDRGARAAPPNCRCRCSASRNILRISGSSIASSICAASICIATS